ncbi:MAG: Crp/Fnr family transcriptional regulator [Natronincolaceae bacterium]|jgi:CRP-like cAMP-binding protein|nr:Crp/Fnr family transcriptional regulator [Bacillota bacterium]
MKINKYFQSLLNIPLFSGFTEVELMKALGGRFSTRDFGRNEIIYIQNEKANSMDIILEGKVIVQSIDENGNILSIVDLEEGSMLGGNLIFSNKNEYRMTVTAMTDTKLFSMDRKQVLKLCQTNEEFLINFLEILSDKALILTAKIHSLSRKTIREKIMDFLIFESNRQNSKMVRLPISKKELAERFGVERPSLQRELRKMKDDGLIDYDSGSIELK